MAWFDVTDQFFWSQSYAGARGTWNGTEWVPNGVGEIHQRFDNNWMYGQHPGYWRFTLNVSSGALGDTSDINAYVLDTSFAYNWGSTLSLALANGVNSIQQVIFFGGANSHLGNLMEFRLDGRDTMSYTLTKIEFSDIVPPQPAVINRCILYKHTGFRDVVDVINPSTTPSGPYGTYGTGTLTGKTSSVSTLSKGWLTAVRFGQNQVMNLHSSSVPAARSGGNTDDGGWTSRQDLVFVPGVDANGNSGGQVYKKDSNGNLTEPSGPFIPSPVGPGIG